VRGKKERIFMSVFAKTPFRMCLVGIAVLLTAYLLQAEVPKGWFLAGSKPAEYESSVDNVNTFSGQPSAYLRSKQPQMGEGFGTLMQNFSADQYIGKRVRFGAFVKSDAVERWSGLWMRVDGKSGQQPLAFDNMMDRPIKGVTGWKEYEVVLDVPQGATGIFFGILLDGPGSVWLSGVKVEAVGTNVPTTGRPMNGGQGPTNLGFEK
jgi:hypothetical protein